jgi:Fic family protein
MAIFRHPELSPSELNVCSRIQELRKQLKFATATPRRWSGLMRRLTLARNIRGSNSIEGYKATVDDSLAVIEGDEPLEAGPETWTALTGYRNAMTYVLQLAKDPNFRLHEGYIRSLHYMMMAHDLDKNPGNWRPGSIYVHDEQKNQTVYEGPDRELVEGLIQELVTDINSGVSVPPDIVQASMAHLNLVMIHPFSDGNGRMARCLQTLVLARYGILEPEFCSVEEHLGKVQQEYYDVLAEVGGGSWHPENSARPWIRFMLKAHYVQGLRLAWRMNLLDKFWTAMEREAAKRKLPERMIHPLVDAVIDLKVRNASYRRTADISENLASRDLKALVKEGLLVAIGENRGRIYQASPLLVKMRKQLWESFKADDPFKIPEQGELPLLRIMPA